MKIQKLHNLKSINEVLNFDFTLSSKLLREDSYDKGKKLKSDWNDPSGITVVRIEYTDILDTNNNLLGVEKNILWFNNLGQVALSKKMKKKYAATEAGTELHSRRKRAIEYLKYRGAELSIKTEVDTLFSHYKDSLYNYLENGTEEFKTSIENEANTAILAILNIKPDISNGVDTELNPTIKDHILSQLN